MPRFRQAIMLTTFYLFGLNDKTGEREGPLGTGVLIMVPPELPGRYAHVYAVTALHVVQRGASIIRMNKIKRVQYPTGGGLTTMEFRYLNFEPHEWQFHPTDDLAAIDVTDSIGHADDLAKGVPVSDFATKGWMNKVVLTMGEDVFMIGLFVGNPGTAYNQAAARFGNISQLAEMRHPVKQGHNGIRPSHVTDMHSRPGFSGSPVFVYRVPGNDLTAIDQQGNFTEDLNAPNTAFVKLLGVHSGQFQEKTVDGTVIPSSMAVVVPAWEIDNLLNEPVFKEARVAREQKWSKGEETFVLPEVVEAQVEPESDNPAHKEDFMRLLGAASKAKPPAS